MMAKLQRYVMSHFHAFTFSLKQLKQTRLSSFMTVMVIGVAFSLPSCLWVILSNAKTVTRNWQHTTQMSLFLQKAISQEQEQVLLKRVRANRYVQFANYISPKEGLRTLEEQTGMIDVLEKLHENPLPAVIEVHPVFKSSKKVEHLVKELESYDGVDSVKIDMQWLLRLDSMVVLAEHGATGLMALFAMAVVLVVGNTIRLNIQNRRKEIEVLKLIGATNRFIRRPFLYFGILYGFLGAMTAWVVVGLFVAWVKGAALHLASLYHADFVLKALGTSSALYLLVGGMFLGFLGARIAIYKQIKAFDPK